MKIKEKGIYLNMQKNKKILIISAITITVFVITYLAYIFWPGKRDITYFYNNDSGKIEKIEYVSGSDGRIRLITDTNDIKKITDILSSATFKRTPKGSASSGWAYQIKVYEGTDEVLKLLQGNGMFINDTHYTMSTSEKNQLFNILNEITQNIVPGEEIGLQ